MKKMTMERNQTHRPFSPRGAAARPSKRECHLCKGTFASNSPFRRFCDGCKSSNELYLAVEWLPQGVVIL